MRILAFSDIHGNLAAIKKLRALEENSFDAVFIAGDVGCCNDAELKFWTVVESFRCPVIHVYGNWDHDKTYEAGSTKGVLLDRNLVRLGEFFVCGYSGCSANWGRNPVAVRILNEVEDKFASVIAEHSSLTYGHGLATFERSTKYRRYMKAYTYAQAAVESVNRQEMVSAVRASGVPLNRLIVMTHDRLFRICEQLEGLKCHVFGHRHCFKHTRRGETEFVNVAALDRVISCLPAEFKGTFECPTHPFACFRCHDRDNLRNVNSGDYAVIEAHNDGQVTVMHKTLFIDNRNWTSIGTTCHGSQWMTEDLDFVEL